MKWKIKMLKERFAGCAVDQAEFSGRPGDLRTAILGIYGIIGTTVGIISALATFGI